MVIWILACAEPEPEPIPYTGCNGQDHLCERAVDEVAYLRAHNSHASHERGYHLVAANHTWAIPTQLEDGVRSLNVDVYEWEGQLAACHGFCELGSQPFDEILDEIDAFLAANEREVVLIDFQDEAPDGAIEAALDAHALGERIYSHEVGTPWPALESLGGQLIPTAGHVYGTGWSYDTPEELDCTVQGEPFEHGLYEVTHVLTNPIASPENAELINHEPVIGDHVDQCLEEVGFIHQLSVDYYSVGDTLAVVERLNAP